MRIGEQGRDVATCELCGNVTPMIGTQRCDTCWELEKYVQMYPELTMKILNKIDGFITPDKAYLHGYQHALIEHTLFQAVLIRKILKDK